MLGLVSTLLFVLLASLVVGDASLTLGQAPGPDEPEAVAEPAGEGAPFRLVLVDRMGDLFALEGVELRLDGRPIEVVGLRSNHAQVLLDDRVAPGRHELFLDVTYAGEGQGLTSYLDDFRFYVTRQIAFDVPEDGAVVTLVIDESGGLTTELARQPALKYRVSPWPDE